MAEENGIVERKIENADIPNWQVGLASAINETYNFNINASLWYGLLPTFMKDYAWKYIKVATEWLDGFVHCLHGDGGQSGIVSTKIGNILITGLTKQVVGEKLMLRLNEECPTEIDKKNLKQASKWVLQNKLISAVYSGIGFAEAIGTSLIKENHDLYGKVWWESVRMDQCTYRTDFNGEVEDAIFLIRGYTDTKGDEKTNQQFFLCEHRFYKDETNKKIEKNEDGTYKANCEIKRVAMVEYTVKKVRGTLNNGGADAPTINESCTVTWDEMPKWLRDSIRRDYGALRVGEEQKLGFDYIGVEVLQDSYIDLAHPKATNLGESKLVKIQSDMITYEVAASYKIRDMYLGKGAVYVPKAMSLGDTIDYTKPQYASGVRSPLTNFGENKIELLKGVDPEQQKAIVQQFDIRGADWQGIMDDCIRNIATKWGMSPKVLSSYLLNSQTTMTATQIDSEDDISIAFINLERSYFRETINRLFESSLNYMGIGTNISVDFASPSLINKDRIIDRQTKLLDAGLTTVDEAIREIYPDLEEEQILKRINDAKAAKQQVAFDELNELNDEGTFGQNNNYDNLGGKNLMGSTETDQ